MVAGAREESLAPERSQGGRMRGRGCRWAEAEAEGVVYVCVYMQWVCVVFASRPDAGWGGSGSDSVWRGVGDRWGVDVVWRVEFSSGVGVGAFAAALSRPLLSLPLPLSASSPAKQPSLSGDGLRSSF